MLTEPSPFRVHHLSTNQHQDLFYSSNVEELTREQSIELVKPDVKLLLEKFYNDLMVPNFPVKDELETFDEFIFLISKGATHSPFCGPVHYVIFEDEVRTRNAARSDVAVK